MRDLVLGWWLSFAQAGLTPTRIDKLILAHLRHEFEKIKPFGTVQVKIIKIIHSKLAGHLRAQDLQLIGENEPDTMEIVLDCLLVRMMSKTGREIVWANLIVYKDGRLVLAAPVVTRASTYSSASGNV
jgi:hypothetical protein